MRLPFGLILIGMGLAIAACDAAAAPITVPSPAPDIATPLTVDATPSLDETESSPSAAAWENLPLVNARTGETFTLANFRGKTVFVHAMARWCTTCRGNQRSIRENVIPQLNADDYVFLSLSVETDDTAAQLATYADDNSFPWLFAVATPELLAALNTEFGPSINVPPSTPRFIVRADGSTTGLFTGAADELALLREAGGEAGGDA